jgi:hypothetical protein
MTDEDLMFVSTVLGKVRSWLESHSASSGRPGEYVF